MQASLISVKGNAMQHRRVHKASVREIWREDKRKIQLWQALIERAIDRASALTLEGNAHACFAGACA